MTTFHLTEGCLYLLRLLKSLVKVTSMAQSFCTEKKYPNEKVGKAIILDFETTGLDRFNDDPVELGFLKVTYANRKNIGGLKVIAQEELNEEDKIVKLNIFSIVEHK